jgi:hypothetical protein
MKRLLSLTNALLAVIAVCLLLIVTKLYDTTLVPPAQAHEISSEPMPVKIVNDRVQCTVEGTVDARMHLYDIGWSPVNGKYGVMLVKAQE